MVVVPMVVAEQFYVTVPNLAYHRTIIDNLRRNIYILEYLSLVEFCGSNITYGILRFPEDGFEPIIIFR
jgi:hypothetical protein